ncbi:DNA replication/repair protein RecF [Acetivibrio straminisolvens]|nr:DNA replication/repair protein RecF [Acetivibrio straminisolvens]
MYIDKISLKNFRNYKDESIEFSKDLNIIYGQNAQGKTNIIEAVFLCASGRSHRTSKDAELVNIDGTGFSILLELKKAEGKKNIGIEYERGKKKIVKINEIPVKKIGNLMGNLLAVIFSPEDILIIKEGPSQRRRFIDITLCQLKPSYFYDLQQYNKILLQRNTLLKEIQNKRSLLDTLEVWDYKIAELSSRIMISRNEFIKRLCEISRRIHFKLTDGSETMEIKYSPSIDLHNLSDPLELTNEFVRQLNNVRASELRRCVTLIGPHRDDYEMLLNGLSLKMFGSQGQQRTSVLSLKLAEIEIIRSETDENPVLLLDDVMSELDSKRREFLLENIKDIQTFITCTDKDLFENRNFGDNLYIRVQAGRAYY